MAELRKELGDMPVQMTENIFDTMSIRQMLPMRAASRRNKAIIDGIITRRHLEAYGAAGAGKSITNKIRDLILEPIVAKLTHITVDTPEYGYELVVGLNNTIADIRPDMPHLRSYNSSHAVGAMQEYGEFEAPDMLDAVTVGLQRDMTTLTQKYPKYQELIKFNYYNILARIGAEVPAEQREEMAHYLAQDPGAYDLIKHKAVQDIAKTMGYNGKPVNDPQDIKTNIPRTLGSLLTDRFLGGYYTIGHLDKARKRLKHDKHLTMDEKEAVRDLVNHKLEQLKFVQQQQQS